MKERFSFEKLKAYEKARDLVKEVYRVIKEFPEEEKYALGKQIQRAAVSIAANLAEGSGRISAKEKIHFIEISFGSLMEVFCELQIATDLGYIGKEVLENLRPQFQTVSQLLSGLRNYFLSTINN